MKHSYKLPNISLALEVPPDWRDESSEDCISFSAPSGLAALTVTLYDDPPLAAEEIESVLQETRPFGDPVSERTAISPVNGTGFSQDFRKDSEEKTLWIAHFYFFDSATIIASVNGTPDEFRGHRSLFEKVLSDIHITT